jgi:hypothetical protein
LLEDLDTATFSDSRMAGAKTKNKDDDLDFYTSGWRDNLSTGDFSESKDSPGKEKQIQQAHAAHRQFEKTRNQSQTPPDHLAVDAPSANFIPESPEILEKLELLDDLVYDAISGQPGALEQLQIVWPTLKSDLDYQMLAESREQYLRFALMIWEACVDDNSIRNPAKAVQALDVLCLLFEE